MVENVRNKQTMHLRVTAYALLLLATLVIYAIAQGIILLLKNYELSSMYISFCAGFILFTPLVSLLLHPLVFVNKSNDARSQLSILMTNFALVLVIQCLFFLIWITDAIVIYSLYVDQNSFLAKSFNIVSENKSNLSVEFYWANIVLAWFFALLSLILGVIPCLIARVDNKGIVNNFVASFTFAKRHKLAFLLAGLCIAMSVVLPLLYVKYLFLIAFPLVLITVFLYLSRAFLSFKMMSTL